MIISNSSEFFKEICNLVASGNFFEKILALGYILKEFFAVYKPA